MRAGASDLVTFLDVGVRPDDHDANGFLFEVEGDAHDVLLGELDELERPDVAEAVYASNTVAHLDNRADLAGFDGRTEVRDLLDEDGVDFFGWRCHICSSIQGYVALAYAPARDRRKRSMRPRTLSSKTWSPTRATTPPMMDGSTCDRIAI